MTVPTIIRLQTTVLLVTQILLFLLIKNFVKRTIQIVKHGGRGAHFKKIVSYVNMDTIGIQTVKLFNVYYKT